MSDPNCRAIAAPCHHPLCLSLDNQCAFPPKAATWYDPCAALRAERDELAAKVREIDEANEELPDEFFAKAKSVADLYIDNERLTADLAAAQAEVVRLRGALKFYADREHLAGDDWSKWDSADMDTINWLCPDSDESLMVEDGFVARAALESKT